MHMCRVAKDTFVSENPVSRFAPLYVFMKGAGWVCEILTIKPMRGESLHSIVMSSGVCAIDLV